MAGGADRIKNVLLKIIYQLRFWGFPGGSDGQESACIVRDLSSISLSGRYPVEGKVYALQYSCMENPMDRGAWQATVHRVTKESDVTEQLILSLSLWFWICDTNSPQLKVLISKREKKMFHEIIHVHDPGDLRRTGSHGLLQSMRSQSRIQLSD